MGCTFKFSDDTECGQERHRGSYCKFHAALRNNEVGVHHLGLLKEYISNNQKDVLDFSKISFNSIDLMAVLQDINKSIKFSDSYFNNIELDGNLSADYDKIQFNNCTFVNADEFKVFKNCKFINVDFENLSFTDCKFYDCHFNNCNIVHSVFRGCGFYDGFFRKVNIKEESEFHKCNFDGFSFYDSFILATTIKQCKFGNLNNIEETQFNTCVFEGVSFVSIFKKSNFNECEFVEKAIFKTSRISSEVPFFENCNFNGSWDKNFILSFAKCKVNVLPSMFENCFVTGQLLDFNDLDIQSDSFYINNTDTYGKPLRNFNALNTYHIDKIDFKGFKFKGHFKYEQINEYVNDNVEIDLTGVNFDNMESAQIINANLQNTIFQNSSIENLKFHRCKWEPISGFKILKDEIIMNDKKNTIVVSNKQLLQLYIQLKKNFEASRNMIDAGDWYYREMEARRRNLLEEPVNKFKNKFGALLMWLYKLVSSYGENYVKPLIIIGIVWFSFSFLYMFDGFAFTDNEKLINYDFGKINENGIEYITDFFKALFYSFSNIILPFKNGSKYVDEHNKILTIAQFFLMINFVPLFLLALRRKFKR